MPTETVAHFVEKRDTVQRDRISSLMLHRLTPDEKTRGQSCKGFTDVNYNSRAVNISNVLVITTLES